MNKIYSIILLFTFLIGTLQPIMPMIEYQLFEGSIVELLHSERDNLQSNCEKVHDLVQKDMQDCQDEDQQLLDTDFYPLALQITTIPSPRVFPIGVQFHLPSLEDIVGPTFLPNPPPPRLI